MATLRMTRDKGYADLARTYIVMVDDRKICELRNGESKEFPIRPGDHSIAAKIDWCGSKTLRFRVKDGDTLSFNISSNLRGLKILLVLWYALFDRDSYLQIEESDR